MITSKLFPREQISIMLALVVAFGCITAALIPSVPAAAADQSVTYAATDDATISQAQPGVNFGHDGQLVNNNTAGNVHKSFLKFNVTGLPTGATVTNATMSLQALAASSATAGAKSSPNNNWSESTITWSNAPAHNSAILSSGVPALIQAGPITFNVTPFVLGNGTWTIVITQSQATQTLWSSKEGTVPPSLKISYSGGTATPSATPSSTPILTTDPVIAAAGDIACPTGSVTSATTCRQNQTSDLLSNATAVLALGDLQYNSGSYSDFLASYDPSWGRFKAKSYPVLGNHEYGSTNAAGYFQYWGSQAGAAGKGWYSYDLGAWHIIAINSNQCALSGCNAGSEQELWVKADLAAHPAACTLAYWHQPRWASGSTMSDNAYMSTLYTDLYDANADLVLAGHNHAYERFQPMNPAGNVDTGRGLEEIIVGTGGRDHSGGTTLRSNSVLRNNNTFGVLNVTLHANSYDYKFQPEAGASFSDIGSRSCH